MVLPMGDQDSPWPRPQQMPRRGQGHLDPLLPLPRRTTGNTNSENELCFRVPWTRGSESRDVQVSMRGAAGAPEGNRKSGLFSSNTGRATSTFLLVPLRPSAACVVGTRQPRTPAHTAQPCTPLQGPVHSHEESPVTCRGGFDACVRGAVCARGGACPASPCPFPSGS